MWGQYFQTLEQAGEAPDMPAAQRLLELEKAWSRTTDTAERTDIWEEMLHIHAEEQFAIGILAGAPQPVVVSDRLHNVPEQAIWAYDPGAHLGIHRIDEFFLDDPLRQVGQ